MASVSHQPGTSEQAIRGDITRKQIRGSSLLLGGRFLSITVNFASQIWMVRYLSTETYGAFAYALSVVAFFQLFTTLGLKEAMTRFVPIYHEKQEYGHMLGTILLVVGTVVVVGLAVVVAFWVAPGSILGLMIDEQKPIHLLSVMIFLVPVEALDGVLMGLFASFMSPRSIFFRRHVLAPGLKLGIVCLLIVWQQDVMFLAYGYLAASTIGVLIYSWVLALFLRRQQLSQSFRPSALKVRAGELGVFAIPMLISSLLAKATSTVTIVLLGYFYNTLEVAFFSVVQPVANLNVLVLRSFMPLYLSTASRLFAKGDSEGLKKLYMQTAVWMAVLSFPIFAVTFSLTKPLILFLYGARYEQSVVILMLLSLRYYCRVILGFNQLTLKVLGKLRYITTINVLAVVTNIGINLLLIPRYGAVGATIGIAGTMIAHHIAMQIGLRQALGFSMFERQYRSFYMLIVGGVLGLCVIQLLGAQNLYVALPLAVMLSLFLVAMNRRRLQIAETFPGLMKLPLMRTVLG